MQHVLFAIIITIKIGIDASKIGEKQNKHKKENGKEGQFTHRKEEH